MNINCPKCTTPVKADSINIEKAIGVCASCNHLFRLDEFLEENVDTSYKKVHQTPNGISSRTALNGLEINLQLAKLTKAWWEFLFGAVFLIFPIVFLYLIITNSGKVEGSISVMYLVITVFSLVGGYMTWEGLCKLINTTTVKIGSQKVEVYSQPINFGKYKKRQYQTSEIEQIFVRRYSNKSQNEQPIYEYAVDFLSKKEGKTAWIIKDLKLPEQAWYIERKIEDYLGLKDKEVLGEFHPSNNYRPSLSEAFGFFRDKWKNRNQ